MSSTDSRPVTPAHFDGAAVFAPADGPGPVLITGTASKTTHIADIQISDGGTPLAGTGGFQSSTASWGVIAPLPANKHAISATMTELSGASYPTDSPHRLVAGLQDQPYVHQELGETSSGVFTRISDHDGAGTLVSQTAVATGMAGQVASSQSPFTLIAGVAGSPYACQEVDHDASGSAAAAIPHAADGSGNTTFLFRRGFGQDEITAFHHLGGAQSPTGIERDVASLPQAVFIKTAQAMRHTTTALDGDAVIHLSPTDSIELDGVTEAELVTHPDVFRFHA